MLYFLSLVAALHLLQLAAALRRIRLGGCGGSGGHRTAWHRGTSGGDTGAVAGAEKGRAVI